jgi:hypothetical protein
MILPAHSYVGRYTSLLVLSLGILSGDAFDTHRRSVCL